MTKCWIEAMRLRTLPVSCAGVVAASAMGCLYGCFRAVPAILCLVFALLAQTASNFANEYYDFKAGLDRPGRQGPRRGVTEGDISPEAMRNATFATLASACAVGCSLIIFGGWLLIPAGVLIAAGVLAYSTGPYPLSRHALGEAAVLLFFGIIPVNMTFYIFSGTFSWTVAAVSAAVGLMGSNILIVNNYRDADDDKAVGKETLATLLGRPAASMIYLLNGYAAVALMIPLFSKLPLWCLAAPAAYIVMHTLLWNRIRRRHGSALNKMLSMTAMLMLLFSTLLALEILAA